MDGRSYTVQQLPVPLNNWQGVQVIIFEKLVKTKLADSILMVTVQSTHPLKAIVRLKLGNHRHMQAV